MPAYISSLKGGRPSNEDAHTVYINNKTEVNIYGVYDGHGGKFISNFLSNNIPLFFLSKKLYPLKHNYVNMVYDKIQNILYTKYEKEAMICGSTCLMVCHFKQDNVDYLNVLNTGDARCVLCNSENFGIPLTKDHKPDQAEEYNRITKLGGQPIDVDGIYRIGSLSVSRAFGDKDEEKYVTHRPDIFLYTLNKNDKFIIVACDGLWDVMDSQEAVNFVLRNCYDIDMKRINTSLNIARIMSEKCIELGSTDNITCIVVFF